jgi:hypothetical protein
MFFFNFKNKSDIQNLKLNETSDILRNSNEFSKTNIINYDAMDAINNATANNATTTTITVNDDQNYTINEADTSAAARINALVMQSVERFKRCVNVGSPINLDSNSSVNPFSNNNNKEKNDDRRFSVSTVKTQLSNMNCDEMNNVTQNQTISYELSNQIDGSTPLRQINNQSRNDESAVQSMSIYFKPDKNVKQEDFVDITNNNDDITYKQQQQQQFTSASFIFDKDNQENGPDLSMFATNGGSSNKLSDFNIFGNGQLNSKDMNLTDSDFKPGNECLSELINAEKQNRKEFTNELSVLATSSSDESKITNEEDTTTTTTTESKAVRDKWWKSQETTSNNLEQTKTQEYFISNSSFPTFLANKDPEMNYSMLHKTEQQQQEQNRPEKEQEQDVTISEEKLKLVSDAVVDFSLSATKNHASSNGSASFSFTLNTSETGDCLIFKKNNSDSKSAETTTPFQAARSVNLYQQKKQQQQATTISTTVTNSNLKTIGEELDRVSNRLAEQMNDTVSTTTITAIATTTTISNDKPTTGLSRNNHHHHHQKNNQLIMTMDETISSINSSSNRTTNLVKKQFNNHHHKQQKAASSLTSTPSKLNKKSEKSIKKDEMTTTSNFLAQESFMSSIPESKTNDSTLVGNHHQYFLTNGSKKMINNNNKNVEIQTSPDKSTSSSTSTPTTSFSSSSTAVDQVVTKLSQEINQTPSQPASSVITTSQMVANLAASLLAAGSNSTSSNNNVNETNSNRTSLFNSSNNNNTGLIPVAFMPIDAVFPYVQKMYDNFQQRSQIDMSTHSIGNSGAGGISNPQRQSSGGLFSSSSLSSDYSAVSTSSSSNNKYKYEMPQLEIDKKSIDFGQIAEGCHDTCRLFAKLTNTNLIQQHREHSIMSNLEIEMDKDILIERVNQQTKCLNKLDDINVVPIISKTIGIQLDKQEFFNLKQNLKLEFVTNYYEFYVHLNTIDLDYFKQQTDSLCNSDEQYNCLEPLAVKTNLSIYYCYIENNCQRKFLLNQIEIKYTIGYARLRSSDLNYINQIEFDLLSIMNRSNRTNYIDHDDNDKTLNSNYSCSSISSSSSTSIENSIQLSNGGNIPINVDCYLIDKNENINNNQDNTKIKLLYLKNKQFQLKIDKSIINLEAKTNANYKKQLVRLILTKINDLNTTMTSFDDLNIHLIFQVMPNGFKYEIPIKLRINTTTTTTNNNNKNLKKMQSLDTITKIFSSKSILFFGRTLADNAKSSLLSEAGLINQFIIKNMNDYKLKYDISISTCLNESASTTSMYDECIDMSSNSTISSASISKAIVNLFKFTPDMKEKSLKEDSSLTRLIIELEPGQEITIRIKFNSSLVESDKNNQLSNVFGIVQLKTFNQQRSNIYLVGFLNRSQLCIDTNENKLVKTTDLQNDQYSKLTRKICNKNLQLFSHEYQLMPTWTDEISCNFSFRKSIQLQNKSFTNSKIIVYLVMYDCKENCELENLQSCDENIIYNLDACLINGFKSRFKLRLEKNKLNRLNNTLWFELSPNEMDSIQIDFEFKLNKSGASSINRKKLIDYFEKNEKKIDQFNISLFWIESEINCQCLNGAQQVKNNNNSLILLEDKFIESFLKRLLTNNAISSSSNGLFINSIITKKARIQFDTIASLMSQALKCSNLKLSFLIKLINNKQYEQNSFNFTNNSFLVTNDQNQVSLLNDLSNLSSLNTSNKDETWSILNDSIIIKNVKFDGASTCFTSKITIKNHLAKKELVFNIAFNSACLDVQPGRGKISPLQTLDVIVRVRRAIANKSGVINGNSWHGIISVICNKVEKDVKVSIYGPSSIASTSSINNNSINNSSILSQSSRQSTSRLSSTSKLLKAPIQSSTLPVPSVTNKRVSTLENIATASTSSLSIADSYLEQGTLLSEPSLDSFSLTPFMNASFQMTASQSTTQRLVSKSVNDDTIIKVLHQNNNAQIKFPSVYTSKSKSYDFTLINPTNSFVSWKAQTPKSTNLQNLTRSTSYSVFKLTPSTGVIQANQKQIIKIEFCPREETGDFQEIWEIETKTSSPTSYSCKLVISGKSISSNDQDKFDNILSDYNAQQRTNKSVSNLSKYKLKDTKENNDPFSCSNNKTSEYDQTIESSNKSNADFDYSLINTRKIIIKTEIIEFTDTCVGAKAKSFILIDNKEEKKCSLSIISLIEPFYCKHPSIDIQPKHYIRVPIEFKPLTKGEYRDKVLIRIEGNEMPLSCVVKGKCV